ncbi:hypothetical protein OGAPHI_002380 [Ogataea philodendri]|uniref:Uncharacterized protein n=1 Tax=Ogataea philodendri TaxID=1378263 RepID=A0A9P8T792_9ASCO|nr:uncharacterized protein OGAPHI_002380 [Ogataea philodendri]KAH3668626.1 hypothetical protein OGAPHI_002380 [Ogataea philodendri]
MSLANWPRLRRFSSSLIDVDSSTTMFCLRSSVTASMRVISSNCNSSSSRASLAPNDAVWMNFATSSYRTLPFSVPMLLVVELEECRLARMASTSSSSENSSSSFCRCFLLNDESTASVARLRLSKTWLLVRSTTTLPWDEPRLRWRTVSALRAMIPLISLATSGVTALALINGRAAGVCDTALGGSATGFTGSDGGFAELVYSLS